MRCAGADAETNGSQVGNRTVAADVGYGVLLARGVLTPFATAQMAGYGRGVRLGTRFSASQANLGFELSGERRETVAIEAAHTVRPTSDTDSDSEKW